MSDTPRKRLIRDTSAPIAERRAAFREHNREVAGLPAVIDHTERSFQLRALIRDAYKFNAECFDEIGDGFDFGDENEPAMIPFRYACLQHDGRGSWLVTGDTLDEIRSTLLEGLIAEYPWTPGEGLDLDTGRRLDARVKVTVEVTDELTPVVPDHRALDVSELPPAVSPLDALAQDAMDALARTAALRSLLGPEAMNATADALLDWLRDQYGQNLAALAGSAEDDPRTLPAARTLVEILDAGGELSEPGYARTALAAARHYVAGAQA